MNSELRKLLLEWAEARLAVLQAERDEKYRTYPTDAAFNARNREEDARIAFLAYGNAGDNAVNFEEFVDVQGAARHVGLAAGTVRNRIYAGVFAPATRIGRKSLFRISDLNRWVESKPAPLRLHKKGEPPK